MFFNSRNFGKCEVICHFKDVALIELEDNYEKYVVTIDLSIKKGTWKHGFYFNNLKDAGDAFNSILEDFYMVFFKI